MGVFILVQHEEIRAKFEVMRYLFNLHLHVGQWVSLFIDEMQTGVIHPVFLDSALDAAFHIVFLLPEGGQYGFHSGLDVDFLLDWFRLSTS